MDNASNSCHTSSQPERLKIFIKHVEQQKSYANMILLLKRENSWEKMFLGCPRTIVNIYFVYEYIYNYSMLVESGTKTKKKNAFCAVLMVSHALRPYRLPGRYFH